MPHTQSNSMDLMRQMPEADATFKELVTNYFHGVMSFVLG